jgi:hypothetical protein
MRPGDRIVGLIPVPIESTPKVSLPGLQTSGFGQREWIPSFLESCATNTCTDLISLLQAIPVRRDEN